MKKLLLVLLAAFIVIQFFRPARNKGNAVTAQEITQLYAVPAHVQEILHKACYDCHSNSTRYPWYSNIQPVAWWMDDHVQEGKGELNFSEFGSYTPQRQAKKLKKCAKEVEEGEMPLDSYTWQHADAKLTAEEKAALESWARNLSAQIAGLVPAGPKK
ncbi:MAG: heme-binding domain-containing protein [Bacteroidota bacterium]